MFKKKNNIKLKCLIIGCCLVILLIFFIWPTNYYIESPGEVDRVSDYLVTKENKVSHNLYLVTVYGRKANMIDYLLSLLRSDESRFYSKEIMGDTNDNQYDQMQKCYMKSSQNNAIYVAAKSAGIKFKIRYQGVKVSEVLPQSRFYSKLKIGDMIIKANKKNIRSSAALIEYLKKYPLHKKLKLTILRNKKEKQVDGKLINIPRLKKNGIGITLLDNTEIITKAHLKICTPDIGGPSAGLMFTLACYQVFTHKRLSMHKKIVGTGTIEADGHVGTIGCIKQKTIAAARANADIFLVPAECLQGEKKSQTNYQIALKTAKKLKTKMKIVPVYNFRDAINYLKNNK